jgi:hypothetical protein
MSIDNWPFGLYAGQPEVSQQEKDKSMYKLLRFRETAADYRGRDSQVPGISSDVRSEREHWATPRQHLRMDPENGIL